MAASATQLYSLHDEDIKTLLDDHVGTANYLLPPQTPVEARPDLVFTSNEEIWQAILNPQQRAHPNLIAQLRNFFLFEWLPRAPGLFHTPQGRQSREMAANFRRHVPVSRFLPAHKLVDDEQARRNREFLEIYDPYGKISMLKGGIGCIRLRPKRVESEELWFMSASSSGIAHEGFPVAIPDHIYQRCIGDIRRSGALDCNIKGSLRFVPETLVALYRGYRDVPQLYLLVEELQAIRGLPATRLVTVGVSFRSGFEGETKMYASYATFDPIKEGSVSETAEWLEEAYVKGLYGGNVITDFDEQMARFDDATFSLNGVMQNQLDKLAVQDFVQTVNIYGGDTARLFAGLSKIEKIYIERIEKMEQSGGVNISGTNISVGGDVVGRDKFVASPVSNLALDHALAPLAEVIRNAPAATQNEAGAKLDALKKEAGKGTGANDSVMAKLVDGLVSLVPGAVGAVVSAFATPLLGGIAGPATKYVLDKIQGK